MPYPRVTPVPIGSLRVGLMGNYGRVASITVALCIGLAILVAQPTSAQTSSAPFTPEEGQPGKDVVWVPTPPELVERMLDLAKVTPQDFVMDLGSGDGRNLIAAAKRGAKGRGVEFNPDMVTLSRRAAADAGVSDRVEIVQGDMYAADISQATVLALFLLPSNLLEFRTQFFNLAPGTRIVANTFGIEGWEPDVKDTPPGCRTWCTALLWIVPAKIEGTWRMPEGDLSLSQSFQKVSGVLGSRPITGGRLRGEEITFTIGDVHYTGRVNGDTMSGTTSGGATWSARR